MTVKRNKWKPVMDMKETNLYDHLSFELCEREEDRSVSKQKYIGGWFISDNGYQPWSFLCHRSNDRIQKGHCVGLIGWYLFARMSNAIFGILKGRRWHNNRPNTA